MKSIYKASNSLEANIVKGLLESNGIRAVLAGEHANAVYGGAIGGMPTEILVDDMDEIRAERIISDYRESKS